MLTQEHTFKSTNPMNRKCDMTRTQCAMRTILFAANGMSALAYSSKFIKSDHRLIPMTHIDKSSPSGQHLGYFCHTCSAMHRTLSLRSLDDCPATDELFQSNILDLQDALLTQRGFRLLAPTTTTWQETRRWWTHLYEMWQEAPAEMKDALY